MFERYAGWLVDRVDFEILDGLQGFAVGTTVGMEARQTKKGTLKFVELPEKHPVWHRALAHIPLFGK